MLLTYRAGAALLGLLLLTQVDLVAGGAAPHLATIKAVGKEGVGNVEAAKAVKELIRQGPSAAFEILTALKDANPVAANYLRGAFEAIADNAGKAGSPLSAQALEKFATDTKQFGPARRLAYEHLVRLDPKAPARLLPTMLDDPGSEMRRDAVATLLVTPSESLKKTEPKKAGELLQKALTHARDVDQLKQIANYLKELGQPVDLTRQLGFLTQWHVVGPFDNAGGKGYTTVYPPEKGINLTAKYTGKNDEVITWKPAGTSKDLGIVDLNKVLGKLKGAVAYAFTEVESAEERPIEVRVGSIVAVRVYLNGQEICGREEYHHGMEIDQYVGRGTLKKGRNTLLIKVCQNEQTEVWAQEWVFQLRVCDSLGGAVPLTVVEPKAKTE